MKVIGSQEEGNTLTEEEFWGGLNHEEMQRAMFIKDKRRKIWSLEARLAELKENEQTEVYKFNMQRRIKEKGQQGKHSTRRILYLNDAPHYDDCQHAPIPIPRT